MEQLNRSFAAVNVSFLLMNVSRTQHSIWSRGDTGFEEQYKVRDMLVSLQSSILAASRDGECSRFGDLTLKTRALLDQLIQDFERRNACFSSHHLFVL